MSARRPGELRDPLAGTGVAMPEEARPARGPIAVLPDARPELVAAVADAGGVVAPLGADTRALVWTSPGEAEALAAALDAHPGIEWVQLPWAGIDAFAAVVAANAQRRMLWTSGKGAYSEPVAEHALALILAVLRDLPEKARRRSWAPRTGRTLFGRRVLLVGAGGIVVELLRLLAPFGVHTTVVRRSESPLAGADRVVAVDRLDEVLPEAEVVVVAAAATGETAHLFDARRLALLPEGSVLVNVARGTLVDSASLVAALESGRLGGAGLDVTDPEPLPDGHPLWSAPRTVVTSHSADTFDMIYPLLAARIRANVGAYLGDGAFIGVVDPRLGY